MMYKLCDQNKIFVFDLNDILSGKNESILKILDINESIIEKHWEAINDLINKIKGIY